jgi:hypothetical protein
MSVLRVLIHKVSQDSQENALRGIFCNILYFSILQNGFEDGRELMSFRTGENPDASHPELAGEVFLGLPQA